MELPPGSADLGSRSLTYTTLRPMSENGSAQNPVGTRPRNTRASQRASLNSPRTSSLLPARYACVRHGRVTRRVQRVERRAAAAARLACTAPCRSKLCPALLGCVRIRPPMGSRTARNLRRAARHAQSAS
eukprot:343940-Chlamydomonas_euryale.AAC.9